MIIVSGKLSIQTLSRVVDTSVKMSGKGHSLQNALQEWKKKQAKEQALSVKMAEDKAKVRLVDCIRNENRWDHSGGTRSDAYLCREQKRPRAKMGIEGQKPQPLAKTTLPPSRT